MEVLQNLKKRHTSGRRIGKIRHHYSLWKLALCEQDAHTDAEIPRNPALGLKSESKVEGDGDLLRTSVHCPLEQG